MGNYPIIDLRSDTVTKPGPEMLEAMFRADVGDDVFEEDPTVKMLEAKAAKLFGKEAGLFVTSGTMANQLAIKVLTQPQDEVICDKLAHIFYYEAGGVAFNSGVSLRVIEGNRGRMKASQIEENINPPNLSYISPTTLVCVENTSNKGGGSYYSLKEMQEISDLCRAQKINVHLDGARIFNALTETGDSAEAVGKLFDTVGFCLSKGLGAPVGSLLLSTKENIFKARRIRKAWGGGMRQAGYLAAAGIYALDHHIPLLIKDHLRAKQIGSVLNTLPWVEEVMPIDTNIIIFRVSATTDLKKLLEHLMTNHIKAMQFGKQQIRMVTHLDIYDEMLNRIEEVLRKF